MYCKNCGSHLPDGVFECPVCHAMLDESRNAGASAPYEAPKENAYAYGNTYAPPQQPYGNAYDNNAWQPHDMQYRQMVEKGETARILAILGLVLGILITPILGWVLGGVSLSQAKQVFAYTGSQESKSTITIAHWAIGVSSVIAGLAFLALLAWIVLVSVGVMATATPDFLM